MALIACTDCGQQMSDAAPACPKCGKPFATRRPKRMLWPAIIVGGVVVVGATGGTLYALNERAKKPAVKTHCTMNGRGVGECTFSNTGTASGAVCGEIVVMIARQEEPPRLRSGTICSGDVAHHSSASVRFEVVGVDDACTPPRGLLVYVPGAMWSDMCAFHFEDTNADVVERELAVAHTRGQMLEKLHTILVEAGAAK